MNALVSAAHALADETRWRILQLVFDQALCVCELAEILDMPQSSVSSHLQVIRKAGLLESERCEKWIYYRLKGDLRPLLHSLADHFAATPPQDARLARDSKKAVKRLARREETCCPGPKHLASVSDKKNP